MHRLLSMLRAHDRLLSAYAVRVAELEHQIAVERETARKLALDDTLDRLEYRAIIRALEMTGWVQKRAAERLGVSARVLCYKMQQHRISAQRSHDGQTTDSW